MSFEAVYRPFNALIFDYPSPTLSVADICWKKSNVNSAYFLMLCIISATFAPLLAANHNLKHRVHRPGCGIFRWTNRLI